MATKGARQVALAPCGAEAEQSFDADTTSCGYSRRVHGKNRERNSQAKRSLAR